MSSYLEQIDHQLAQKRREIEELEIARSVLMKLKAETEAPRVLALKADVPSVNGKITIRKVTRKTSRAFVSAERERYRDGVRAYLTEHGPAPTAKLMEHFGLTNGSKAEKQVLYQVMYDMKRVGELNRDDSMVYSFAAGETEH